MEMEEMAKEGDDTNVVNELKGWSKEEKFYLLEAIKVHGSRDVQKLSEYIPSKTAVEIKEALEFYRKKTSHSFSKPKRKAKKKMENINSPIPLCNWAKYISDSLPLKDLSNEIPTALRLIAECEDIPIPSLTEHIDFKAIYHMLANAVEGKALEDDETIAAIMEKCVVETALTSNDFFKCKSFKSIVSSLQLRGNPETTFHKPTHDTELLTLRHLITSKNYNPLNIPEEFLMASAEIKQF